MAEYAEPLKEEQLKQYENIISEIRKSADYNELLEARKIMAEETKKHNDEAKKTGKIIPFSKEYEKASDKEGKLLKKVYQQFSEKAEVVIYGNNHSKKSFWNRFSSQKSSEAKSIPTYVDSAFFKELEHTGSFKQTYDKAAEEYNKFHGFAPKKQLTKEQLDELRGVVKPEKTAEKSDVQVHTQTKEIENPKPQQEQSIVIPEQKTSTVEMLMPQDKEVQTHSDLYNALETYARVRAVRELSGLPMASGISYNGMDEQTSLDVLKHASPADLKQAIGAFKANVEKNPMPNADFSNKISEVVDKLPEQLAPESKVQKKENNEMSLYDEYGALMSAEPFNAEALYNKSNEIMATGEGDKTFLYGAASYIATKDPTYNPQQMLGLISQGLDEDGFEETGFKNEDNIKYTLDNLVLVAEGIRNIAANNTDNHDMSILSAQAMHKLAGEVLAFKAEHHVVGNKDLDLSFSVCQEHIIKGYGEMNISTDGFRKQALKNIDKCAQAGNYREHFPNQIINSVNNILQGDKNNNPEVAALAYTAIKDLTPIDAEDAMQMLDALQKIGNSGDRNLQKEMVEDVYRIFKKFGNSEEIQRKCLETIKPFGEKGVNNAKARADSFEKIINRKVAAGKSGREGGYEKTNEKQDRVGNSREDINIFQASQNKGANDSR